MNYQDLLTKFFSGKLSAEDSLMMKKWIDESPEHRKIFDQANELWQTSISRSKHFDVDAAWELFSSRQGLRCNIKPLKKKIYWTISVAASIIILFIIGSIIARNKSSLSLNDLANSKIVVSAKDGEKAIIMLSDSSEVILNSGSRLEYDATYNLKNRNVTLTGEAFFDIHTDPEKPFIVSSEEIRVIATGTRFNVLSFPEENRIEASLEEGEISVISADGKSASIKPGEQLVYTKQSKDFEVKKIHIEAYTSWKENKLRLSDTPLEESLRKIARKYNVTFNITDAKLLDLKYTATFIDEDIEEVMEMLKVVSPITYKISYRTGITDHNYIKPMILVAYKEKS